MVVRRIKDEPGDPNYTCIRIEILKVQFNRKPNFVSSRTMLNLAPDSTRRQPGTCTRVPVHTQRITCLLHSVISTQRRMRHFLVCHLVWYQVLAPLLPVVLLVVPYGLQEKWIARNTTIAAAEASNNIYKKLIL